MVYYFVSIGKLPDVTSKVVFVVPSGNFGNLTAGLFAKKMGLSISHFIVATNVNDTVPLFLAGKGFIPRASVATISNAMDVGNPSNFGRMLELFDNSPEAMSNEISGFAISDKETEAVMRDVFNTYKYIADPHGAVGIAGWKQYSPKHKNEMGIILETAHPAKFIDTVEKVLKISIPLPDALEKLRAKSKSAKLLLNDFIELKNYLMSLK